MLKSIALQVHVPFELIVALIIADSYANPLSLIQFIVISPPVTSPPQVSSPPTTSPSSEVISPTPSRHHVKSPIGGEMTPIGSRLVVARWPHLVARWLVAR